MFTGIVKALGKIISLEEKESILRYAVEFPRDFISGLEIGASVSIDGTCQTVVALNDQRVWFEAIEETLEKTTLKNLKIGQSVNLERAAKFGDEIGGHLLSGHIYGTATLTQIDRNIYTFTCEKGWMKYLFSKGFIALDGASLTLVDVDRDLGTFTVHLIPETLQRTVLGAKKVGDSVNLELDALTQAIVETVERLQAI